MPSASEWINQFPTTGSICKKEGKIAVWHDFAFLHS